MKANLSQREPTILKKWEDLNLYQKIRELNKDKPRFIFHNGPPYANGHIHMGTALNQVLKDIVVKSKNFSGQNAPFVPGWDCHGLPIELNVEKKVGKAGVKIDEKKFRDECRAYANNFINIQRNEFKRLGIFSDWNNPYLTMAPNYEANIMRALGKIIRNGHLQKGYKPVHWCLDCGSALAEAEVEYADKTSYAIDVKFRVVDSDNFSEKTGLKVDGDIIIPIWTTTPWTLPANEAVALNANLTYSVIETDNEVLVVAEELREAVLDRYNITNYQELGLVLGQVLEGLTLEHPFYNKQVPLVLSDHVTVENGTGAVHTAPAHGQDDYVVGLRYGLPVNNPVNDKGCFTDEVELFAGLHVNKANDPIIATLKEKNTLMFVTKVTHSYPHCWRHKTPLIFRSTPQWFINMDQNKLREMSLQAIEKVQWIPDWGKQRIGNMVASRPDWCISRQRVWGVPLPLFIHRETDELHPDTLKFIEDIAKLVEVNGIEAWHDLNPQTLLGGTAKDYVKCTDILDVWFDSGASHEAVLKQNKDCGFPADLYLEGSDQHRGWFQASLLTSVAINNVAPYKTVLTHGYVIDVEGRKMSKSLGNVIAPEKIIQSSGADVLRLWVASTDYRGEVNVSEEILSRIGETYRRIRNTARFLLANLDGFDPKENRIPSDQLLALDAWAIDKARLVQEEIIKAYEAYQFHVIYQKIHQFCSIEMGSFYLDIIKDRQYTTPTNSLARRSAQTAMFHIMEALVRWLAPILSFTAEEIWQYIPGQRNESVFLNTWYEGLPPLTSSDMTQQFWENIQKVRNAVNKEIEVQRNAGKIGSALEASVKLYCSAQLKEQLDSLKNELKFILITSQAEVLLDTKAAADEKAEVPGLRIEVLPLSYEKCERCWHRSPYIGENKHYPTLCDRCIINITTNGEHREFA